MPPARIARTGAGRAASASSDRSRVGREVGDGEGGVGLDEVEAVVDDPAPLGERRLRRPDVEPAVDLARVGRDDLGGDPLPRQALGDVDREARLAGRGGARDDEERREPSGAVAHSGASVPRSAYGPACSIRARTRRPTSSGPPARWTSLFWRLRPAQTCGPPARARRVARRPSWSWRPRRGRRASTRTSTSRPSQASVALERRSPPGAPAARSAGARLTSGGTSSARCVAGVPGRSEYAAAKTWS